MERTHRGEKGLPIKGLSASRDSISGAVVFDDPEGYQKAVKRKRANRFNKEQFIKIQHQNTCIINLEKKVEILEYKIEKILESINK